MLHIPRRSCPATFTSGNALLRIALIVGTTAPLQAQLCQTERVNLTSTGLQLPFAAGSNGVGISGDGRFVLFDTPANAVVPGDNDNRSDVFLRDLQSGTIRRLSLGLNGAPPSAACFGLALSGDGRTALMLSSANNLVPGDTNGWDDLFTIDIQSGVITRVDVGPQGQQSVGGAPIYGSLSRNGRRVAFVSGAADLVPGDTNASLDVFVRDLDSGVTTRVSVDSTGTQANGHSGMNPLGEEDSPALSADGRFVVFSSAASNLVPGDTNGASSSTDVFVHDTQTGITERVSVASGGVQLTQSFCGDATISADGRRVAFVCQRGNPGSPLATGVYLRDRVTGITSPIALSGVSNMADNVSSLWMTPDGSALAFSSNLPNLVPGVTSTFFQAYVANLATGTLRLVSVAQQGGAPASAASVANGITDDATTVLMLSFAPNLVPNDTNGAGDVFVRECPSEWATTFCAGTATACPCGNAGLGNGGCDNSQATGGAKLRATGLASVSNDLLSLIVSDTTVLSSAPTLTLFLQGSAQAAGGQGAPLYGGLICVAGSLQRLGLRGASNATAWFGKLGGDTPISSLGMVPASGATRHYQVLYRDPASTCGGTSNTTNGVSVQWAP